MSQTPMGNGCGPVPTAIQTAQPRAETRKPSARAGRRTARIGVPAGLLAAILGLCCAGSHAQTATATKPLLGAPTPAVNYQWITWDALAPPGWDGMKGFAAADLQKLDDADPAAAEMLKKMRKSWDNAPVNMQLVGQPVRLAGYVVPLEQNAEGLTEFLLVPYYGACIHTPPPPANQIVQVLPRRAAKGVKSMDTVSISGVLRYVRNDSYMGTSSWRLEAVSVEPFVDKRPGVVTPQ